MPRLTVDPALNKTVVQFRNGIRDLEKQVRHLMAPDGLIKTVPANDGLRAEGFANTMLAVRHLEDARMRLGKVLQAAQGGESIFDKQEQDSVGNPS